MKNTHQFLVVINGESRILMKSVRWVSLWFMFALLGAVAYANLLTESPTVFTSPPMLVADFAYFIQLGLPIAAVIMSFDVVTGGIEDRTLNLALSYPVGRSRIFLGKALSRFVLSAVPMVLLFAILFVGILVSGTPLTLDFAWRFLLAIIILATGLLFWGTLSAAISTFTRTSTASLLYCVALLGIIWYNVHFDLIQSLILSLWLGHPVALSQFFLSPDYKLEVLFGALVPPNVSGMINQLFLTGTNGSFVLTNIFDWLSHYGASPSCANCYGFPNFILLSEAVVFVLAFIGIGVHRFRNIRV